MLEKTFRYREYCNILKGLHKDSITPIQALVNMEVKALGFYSPYGSYWIALSMINDKEDPDHIEPFVKHVETWSEMHISLKPRASHLRAELECSSDSAKVT
jgi:hypothetical protein